MQTILIYKINVRVGQFLKDLLHMVPAVDLRINWLSSCSRVPTHLNFLNNTC